MELIIRSVNLRAAAIDKLVDPNENLNIPTENRDRMINALIRAKRIIDEIDAKGYIDDLIAAKIEALCLYTEIVYTEIANKNPEKKNKLMLEVLNLKNDRDFVMKHITSEMIDRLYK